MCPKALKACVIFGNLLNIKNYEIGQAARNFIVSGTVPNIVRCLVYHVAATARCSQQDRHYTGESLGKRRLLSYAKQPPIHLSLTLDTNYYKAYLSLCTKGFLCILCVLDLACEHEFFMLSSFFNMSCAWSPRTSIYETNRFISFRKVPLCTLFFCSFLFEWPGLLPLCIPQLLYPIFS